MLRIAAILRVLRCGEFTLADKANSCRLLDPPIVINKLLYVPGGYSADKPRISNVHKDRRFACSRRLPTLDRPDWRSLSPKDRGLFAGAPSRPLECISSPGLRLGMTYIWRLGKDSPRRPC